MTIHFLVFTMPNTDEWSRQFRQRFREWQFRINWRKRVYLTIAENCARVAKDGNKTKLFVGSNTFHLFIIINLIWV